MGKPKAAKREPDPIDRGAHAADQELSGVFHDLASSLRFVEFNLRMEDFLVVRRLVLLDRFTSETDEKKAERLGMTVDELARLRVKGDGYAQMLLRLEDAWNELRTPKTVREHVDDVRSQDEIFRRTMRMARTDASPLLTKYLEAFNDRAMPRITKETGGKTLFVNLGDLKHLDQVEEAVKKMLEGGDV